MRSEGCNCGLSGRIWFELDRKYNFREQKGWFGRMDDRPSYVSARLWTTGHLREWSGAQIGIYLWLTRSLRRPQRDQSPRSAEFEDLSQASKILNLSDRTLRRPTRSMESDGFVQIVRKDNKRWIQLVNPDFWPAGS